MASSTGSGDEMQEVEVNLLDDQEEIMVDFFDGGATVSNANRLLEENNALDESLECCRVEDATEEGVEDPSTNNEGGWGCPQLSQDGDNMEGHEGSGSVVGVEENLAVQGEVTGTEREVGEVSTANVVQVGNPSVIPFLVNIGCASDKGQENQEDRSKAAMEREDVRPPHQMESVNDLEVGKRQGQDTSNRSDDDDGQRFPEGTAGNEEGREASVPIQSLTGCSSSATFQRKSKEPQPSTSKNWDFSGISAPKGTEGNEENLITSPPVCGENYDDNSENSSNKEIQEGNGGSTGGGETTRKLQKGQGSALAATQAKKKGGDVSAPAQKAKISSKSKRKAGGPPARKKPRKDPPNRAGWVGGKEWLVEEVVDSRIAQDKDGNSYNEYCVKWAGYDANYNSWAREADTFEKKIKEYWEKVVKKINRLNCPLLNVPVAKEPSTLCYFDLTKM